MNETSDEKLLRLSQDGDRDALAELVGRYQDLVYRICLRRLLRPDLAQDAAQNAFRKLLQGLHLCREAGAFKAWLSKIAYHSALDTGKDEMREKEKARMAGYLTPGGRIDSTPEAVRRALEQCVDGLPPDERMAVSLHFFENMPHRDVAQVLSCSHMTVQRRIKKALEQLQVHLERAGVSCTVAGLGDLLVGLPKVSAPAALAGALSNMVSDPSLPLGVASASLEKTTVSLGGIVMSKKILPLIVLAMFIGLSGLIGIGAWAVGLTSATDDALELKPESPAGEAPAGPGGGSTEGTGSNSGTDESGSGEIHTMGGDERGGSPNGSGEGARGASPAGSGGEIADAPLPPPEFEGSGFYGRVTDSVTGKPIVGAVVKAYRLTRGRIVTEISGGAPPIEATCIGDGSYGLPVPSNVEFGLLFGEKEYRPDLLQGFRLDEGEKKPVSMALTRRSCTVSGTVTHGEGGKAMVGVAVRILWAREKIETSSSRYDLVMLRSSRIFTDDQGRFETKVAPGIYKPFIRHAGYEIHEGLKFVVRGEEMLHFSIPLTALPAEKRVVEFGGRITDGADGQGLRAVRVLCSFSVGAESREIETNTDASGNYTLRFPGNVWVRIEFSREGFHPFRIRPFDPLSEPHIDGDWTLQREGTSPESGFEVTGTVRDKSSLQPLGDVKILISMFGGGHTINGGWRSDGEGHFRIFLPVRRKSAIRLMVKAPGFQHFFSEEMELQDGAARVVGILLERTRTFIEGTVTRADNGKPVARAVVLIGGKWDGEPMQRVLTDEEGRYVVEVMPGEHSILCQKEGYRPAKAGGFMDFEVKSGERKLADLVLHRYDARVRGRVLNGRTKTPIDGVEVECFEITDGEYYSRPGKITVTDRRGGFDVALVRGTYNLLATRSGYAPAWNESVSVAGGTTPSIDIEMVPLDGSLSGRIVDAVTGRPLEGRVGLRIGHPLSKHLFNEKFPPQTVKGATYSARVCEGTYTLLVRHYKGYFKYEKEIFVRAGEKRTFDVALEPVPQNVATITGILSLPDGEGGDNRGYVRAMFRGVRVAKAVPGADGKFTLAVPAGRIEVIAHYQNKKTYEVFEKKLEIDIEAGETKEIEIELTSNRKPGK